MFHEMRYVYEVYRHRSFSKAARALYISQPSLSLMVKKAETRIGSPIFDRSVSPVALTEVGRAYIRAAMQIMAVETEFERYVNDERGCLTGTLSLGGTALFTSYVLPPLISAFSARHPGVEICLREAHTAELKRSLQEGELDLVADNGRFDSAVYEAAAYRREQIVLAVPAHWAVNRRLDGMGLCAARLEEGFESAKPAPLEAFAQEEFLLLKEGNDTRIRAEKLCAQAGFRPCVRLQLDHQIAAYNLAAFGMGAAFVSDTLARSAQPDSRLCFYRLAGEAVERDICFFYKRNRFITSAMRAFLEMVKET